MAVPAQGNVPAKTLRKTELVAGARIVVKARAESSPAGTCTRIHKKSILVKPKTL
jgi:hypothetical protein